MTVEEFTQVIHKAYQKQVECPGIGALLEYDTLPEGMTTDDAVNLMVQIGRTYPLTFQTLD